jgi:hypothetical protein
MPSCPACGRGVAVARAACLYCGAPLAPDPGAPSQALQPTGAAHEPSRQLLLLDLAVTPLDVLTQALAVSRYEAALLARRGGLHLVRAAGADEVESEAGRLRAAGAASFVVPEAEVRAPPVACLAGERRGDSLVLRAANASVPFPGPDPLLVVRGPIAREYQSRDATRRIATARPAEGRHLHLHRRNDPRPLEIDALNFETGFAASGSAQLEIDAWIEAVASGVPRDDGFARLPPALAPALPEPGGALAAFGSLAAARGEAEGRLVLDNLAQFRFYSGCLAAVARRRD